MLNIYARAMLTASRSDSATLRSLAVTRRKKRLRWWRRSENVRIDPEKS